MKYWEHRQKHRENTWSKTGPVHRECRRDTGLMGENRRTDKEWRKKDKLQIQNVFWTNESLLSTEKGMKGIKASSKKSQQHTWEWICKIEQEMTTQKPEPCHKGDLFIPFIHPPVCSDQCLLCNCFVAVVVGGHFFFMAFVTRPTALLVLRLFVYCFSFSCYLDYNFNLELI